MTTVYPSSHDISPLDLEASRLDQVRITTPDGHGSIRCSGWGIRQRSSGAWLFTPGSHIWGVGIYEHTRVSAPVHLATAETAKWVARQGVKSGAYLMAFD